MQGPLKPFYCDVHYFIIIVFFLFYVIQYFEDAKMIRETSLYYTILSFEHNTLSHVEATATFVLTQIKKSYIFWLSLTFAKQAFYTEFVINEWKGISHSTNTYHSLLSPFFKIERGDFYLHISTGDVMKFLNRMD